MSKPPFHYYTLTFLPFVFFIVLCTAHERTYIVHVAKPDDEMHPDDLKAYHESFLPSKTTSDYDGRQSPLMIYSYKHVISGFAAKLTPQELEYMKKTKPGFISAREESILHPHTTHSPDFLGLHYDQAGFWKSSNYGQGVIIAVIDTGILPNHPSFDDKGMPPPPARWKGRCDPEFNTTPYRCNNKLIGARRFYPSPRPIVLLDSTGHGTHTASTAAGNFAANASLLGEGRGTAAGVAPRAHLAIYGVCSVTGCRDSDILAGLDAAIEDGVDVISVSLGESSRTPIPFYKDVIAVGSFAAAQRNVLVSCSAGNSGPTGGTVGNDAPWILTVGAGTMDRSMKAVAKLGDGQEFDGESVFQPADFPSTTQYPLVYAPDGFCDEGGLQGVDVKGKIVLCDDGNGFNVSSILKSLGASGMILANAEPNGYTIILEVQALPATGVSFAAGEKIKAYINSTKNPTATIVFEGTVIGDAMAPVVASFSSRGPSARSPGIVKPDIIGPGVNVLAAWPFPLEGPKKLEPSFNFLSGTSMSCPHLSGVAALLRSAHPNWSPAAIKSAIMTTADVVNMKGEPILDQSLKQADAYGSGSGHVNPSRANDPGLIYDIAVDDYVLYLCGLKNYTEEQVGMIVHKKVNCTTKIREGDLNYPTFAVELGSGGSKSYVRTVTNVGLASSSYSVKVVAPKGVSVSVVPQKLEFKGLNEKLVYNVTFTRSSENVTDGFSQGYLEWVSGKYVVRGVIVATFA